MNALPVIDKYIDLWKRNRKPCPPMLDRLVRFWLRCDMGAWMIRDQHERLVPLKPNDSQAKLFALMLEQAAKDEPIRGRILKTRKRGMSTFVQCLFVDLCSHWPNQKALTVAHEAKATQEIFDIAHRAAKRGVVRCDDTKTSGLWWPDTESHYACQSAGSTAVAAGGTPNLLHHSEKPKWEKNKEETHYNTLNAVPMTPTSIVLDESTAKGRELFWNLWEQSEAGTDQYFALFIPWMEDTSAVLLSSDIDLAPEDLSVRTELRKYGYEVSDAQLRWRRAKIAEIGEDIFRQEYPATPEEAVAGSQGLIYPTARRCMIEATPYDLNVIGNDVKVGGIDFGYHDATAIWSGVYMDQTLFLLKHWRAVESMPDEQVAGLVDGTRYWCDPSSVEARKALQSAAWQAGRRVNLLAAPRHKTAGEDFIGNEIRAVRKMMDDGRLKVLRSCSQQFIIEGDQYVWNDATGKPDQKRADETGHFDTMDALRYLVAGLIPGYHSQPVKLPDDSRGTRRARMLR